MEGSIDSSNFFVKGYLPSIQKASVSDTYSLAGYRSEEILFVCERVTESQENYYKSYCF